MSGIKLPVGKNAANRAIDVKVIQEKLNQALDKHPEFKKTGINKLAVDGVCGTLTIAAIEKFQQTVLKWSGGIVDGRVDINKPTWKKLNGNVPTPAHIVPKIVPMPQVKKTSTVTTIENFQQAVFKWGDEIADELVDIKKTWENLTGNASTPAHIVHKKIVPVPPPQIKKTSSSCSIEPIKQGNYTDNLGVSCKTISSKGCALCTLTMAATAIGSLKNNKYLPKDLTPQKVNQIFKENHVFSKEKGKEYWIGMKEGANALGMNYEEYGKNSILKDDDTQKITTHLKTGGLVAAYVDYTGGSEGDHWILITRCDGDTFACLDPASGKPISLTKNVKEYEQHKGEKRKTNGGVLFGNNNSGHANIYVVRRFGLLSPKKLP